MNSTNYTFTINLRIKADYFPIRKLSRNFITLIISYGLQTKQIFNNLKSWSLNIRI